MFQSVAGPPREAGYQLAVLFRQAQRSPGSTCSRLPEDLRLLVADQEVPAAFDDDGCLNTAVVSATVPSLGTVTVDVMDGDETLAHAEFEGLTPGAGARLAVPADGQVRAGDEIVIVPPPELPTGRANLAYFYPLEDESVAVELIPLNRAERHADGVHVRVPAFTGRAAVIVWGMPYVPQPTFTCPGFDFCVADADHTLGPVFVTGAP
jgi:hypothetical protein